MLSIASVSGRPERTVVDIAAPFSVVEMAVSLVDKILDGVVDEEEFDALVDKMADSLVDDIRSTIVTVDTFANVVSRGDEPTAKNKQEC